MSTWSSFLRILAVATLLAAPGHLPAADAPDIVLGDFEGETYGGWRAEGPAFGAGPARGTLPNQQPVSNFLGRGLVNSYAGGDRATGVLTSAEFRIDRNYLNFLVGGGNHPGAVSVNLVVNGVIEETATGHDSERLLWHTWQLFRLRGQTARIQIVDRHTGGWGHINADHFILSDRHRVTPYATPAITRAMTSVAEATPRVQDDPQRPIYHFLAPAQWMNDPNGPLFHNGYYHLFYQYNPFGDQWGHMHWGHARSRDLVTWKHLPIALAPAKEHGEDHVFSGCATISPQGRPMIFYTSIGRGKSATDYAEQWAAIGDNDLYTWSRPTNNPVLHEHVHGDTKVYDWRDPFLFEHEGRHFLVTGGNLNRGRGGAAVVTLYEADGTNLLSWRYRGVLFTHPDPKVTNIECPNFFKLRDRWVLIISPHREVEYFVGRFDAEAGRFTSERDGRLDHSGHFYAPNSLVDPEGRRVLWGWVRGFPDGLGWNGCLTLPRVLALNDRGELLQESLPALTRLRGAALTRDRLTLTNATNVLDSIQGDALEIETHLDRGTARDVTLWVRRSTNGDQAVPVSWDGSRLTVDGIAAPVPAAEGSRALKLRVFVDKSVLEVYAHDRICLTRVLKSRPEDVGVAVGAREGTATVELLRAWPMRSIW